MIDEDALRHQLLSFHPDRPITDDELLEIEGGAVAVSYSTGEGWLADAPQDMSALALMFGIAAWRSKPGRPSVYWPTAAEGTDAFSFNLLWQMSDADPDPFAMLRKLPLEQWNPFGEHTSDSVAIAFAAGLAVGVHGHLGALSPQVKAHLESRARVNEMLVGFTEERKTAAEERRAKLFSFATEIIGSDPHATTAQIARAYRKAHRPKAAQSTDLEETEIRAWRKSGGLPARVLRKVARDS